MIVHIRSKYLLLNVKRPKEVLRQEVEAGAVAVSEAEEAVIVEVTEVGVVEAVAETEDRKQEMVIGIVQLKVVTI